MVKTIIMRHILGIDYNSNFGGWQEWDYNFHLVINQENFGVAGGIFWQSAVLEKLS